MRIIPPAPEIPEDGGFGTPIDIFKLKHLADGMTNLVTESEDPLVIAFNGDWGTGKTTFLKMWKASLTHKGYPAIYFDAFEHDYMDDAFAALVREIAKLGHKDGKLATLLEHAKKLGVSLFKSIPSIALQSAVTFATGGMASTTTTTKVIRDAVDHVGKAAENYFDHLMNDALKQEQTIDSFKKALSDLPKLLNKDGESKPLVFIIDELDRCRPHFALAILERIKHFFSAPNVHFVLGVNMSQLEASVKATYGDIDATTYLQKFVNVTILNTDVAEHTSEKRSTRYLEHLISNLSFRSEDKNTLETVKNNFIHIAEAGELSLRNAERIFSQVALSLASTSPTQKRNGVIVVGLCTLKILRPDLFLRAKKGTLSFEQIEEVLGLNRPSKTSSSAARNARRHWAFFLGVNEDNELLRSFQSTAFDYDLSSPIEFVPFVANNIVDRLNPA